MSIVQNQLQMSKQEIEQLKTRVESLRQTAAESEKESSQIVTNNEPIKDDLHWTSSERQQGEVRQSSHGIISNNPPRFDFQGSESGNTENSSADVAVKTLENVLFGNNNNNSRMSSSNPDKPRHVLFEDVELERQRMEEEMNKTKYRLLNTTELLNESELNNVRLIEQVAVLKDEIRRIERNMDRAESISNLEYLKNIVMKFFILKSSHERLQLIPVLVTMLKLSPDEQAKLVRVAQVTTPYDSLTNANGQQANDISQANAASSSTWGSYLGMW